MIAREANLSLLSYMKMIHCVFAKEYEFLLHDKEKDQRWIIICLSLAKNNITDKIGKLKLIYLTNKIRDENFNAQFLEDLELLVQ